MQEASSNRAHRTADTVGAYVLGEVLGVGGMGVVYATTHASGAPAAIKFLHPEHLQDPRMVRHLRDEALAAGYVSHRNVVAVLDASAPEDPVPFLVMERVQGIHLSSLLRSGALPLRQVVEFARQILAGLGEIHAVGVVHGDIKSDNILVEKTGDGTETVKIIDFGLASIRRGDQPPPSPDYDRHGDLMASGTPEYMAPEVIRGGVAVPESDLYAVAVIIYEMLTGKTPFSGGPAATVLARHLTDDVVPPSLRCPERTIPDGFERAIMRALEKETSARFATAAEFTAALELTTLTFEPSLHQVFDVTPANAFSTVATTRTFSTCSAERPRAPRFARGTRSPSTPHLANLRASLCLALEWGAVDDAIVTSLEIVRAQVDAHQLHAAVGELEATIGAITRAANIAAADAPPLWRLLLTLAALYQGIGDSVRARRSGNAAHRHATLHASKVGCERATALLARLPGAKRQP